ncbi:WD repeat-containing protein 6 [Lecanora helva]
MEAIRHESFLLPVTALTFCQLNRLYLLSGEGHDLKIFDSANTKLLFTERVFENAVIRGIAYCHLLSGDTDRARILIWGGQSTCVIDISDAPSGSNTQAIRVNSVVQELRLNDRILDGCFQDHDSNTGALGDSQANAFFITAHNQLLKISLCLDSSSEYRITSNGVSQIALGSRLLLYSAHLVWSQNGSILIAAGTVFGEVILWSCDVSSLGHEASPVLHHVFVGHEGSVFGVRISNCGKDGKRILASCSDDRTIRVHAIDTSNAEKVLPRMDADTVESGDWINRSLENYRQDGSDGCLATIMGHASRIWGLRFLCCSRNLRKLISHGEDGTAQVWSFTCGDRSHTPHLGNAGKDFKLSHESTFSYHTGKNLWALAVHRETPDAIIVASGGADGRISTYTPDLRKGGCIGNACSCRFTIEEASAISDQIAEESVQTQTTPTPTLTKQLFDSLEGSWNLSRSIDSRLLSYPSGNFTGTTFFEKRSPSDRTFAAEYLYSEKGDFMTVSGVTMEATRQYVYRYDGSSDVISVWFVKPNDGSTVDYFFHSLDFSSLAWGDPNGSKDNGQGEVIAKGHHLCNEDSYSSEYDFQLEDFRLNQWSLKYRVAGPKKDYTTVAVYTHDIGPGEQTSDASSKRGTHNAQGPVLPNSLKSWPDTFKTYSWIDETTFLASTQTGDLREASLYFSQRTGQEVAAWRHVGYHTSLQSSCLAASIPDQHVTFLTGLDGTILLYRHGDKILQPVYSLSRKAGFLKAQHVSALGDGVPAKLSGWTIVSVFATRLGSVEATALFFKSQEEFLDISSLTTATLILPLGFVVTSSCFINQQGIFVLGSRSGDLVIYTIRANHSLSSMIWSYRGLYNKIHGSEAVSAVEYIPADLQLAGHTCILTAGRDGTYAIHQLSPSTSDESELQISLDTLHIGTLPFGPNIEGLCIARGDLFLWGFRSTDFVVWNESQKMEHMSVTCGGAHRNWAYYHNVDEIGESKFVYTKASACHIYTQAKASHKVFQYGAHGREIKAMAISPPIMREDRLQARYLATGAEDTAIRLFNTNTPNEEKKCLAVLTKHTTGLQKLHWSPNGRHLFSAAGCEEFYVWRVQPAPLVTIGVVCEAKCPLATAEGDLRIMDFAVIAMSVNNGSLKGDPDYLLSMAYSDSSIRIFSYRTHDKAFTLLSQGIYTTHCLTQISYIHTQDMLSICTGSADGHLAFWPLPFTSNANKDPTQPSTLTPTHKLRTHQSSILSLLCIPLSSPSSTTLLITSGDDGAISLLRLPHSYLSHLTPNSLTPTLLLKIPKAHAGAVTALAYLGPTTTTTNSKKIKETHTTYHFASISPDQRLKTWRVSIDFEIDGVEGVDVRKVGDVGTGVADASAVEVCSRGREGEMRVWVVGVGMEGWGVGGEGGEEGW